MEHCLAGQCGHINKLRRLIDQLRRLSGPRPCLLYLGTHRLPEPHVKDSDGQPGISSLLVLRRAFHSTVFAHPVAAHASANIVSSVLSDCEVTGGLARTVNAARA